jgi:hypothetical protein
MGINYRNHMHGISVRKYITNEHIITRKLLFICQQIQTWQQCKSFMFICNKLMYAVTIVQ